MAALPNADGSLPASQVESKPRRAFPSSPGARPASLRAVLSHRPWTTETFTRLLFGVMGALAAATLTAALLDSGIESAWPGLSEEDRQVYVGCAATLVLHGGVLASILVFLRSNRLNWRTAFGIQRRGIGHGIQLALGVAAGFFILNLGLMKFSELLWTQLGFAVEPQEAIKALQAGGVLRPVLLAIVALGVAPVMEELIYRGLLYPTVKQLGFPRTALWGTSILFAMSHVNLLSFLPLVCFGALLAWLYETTDNLLAPIAAHFAFNAINFVLALVLTGPVVP